jgi:hypothetical protein
MVPLLMSETPLGNEPLIVRAGVELPGTEPLINTPALMVARTGIVPFQPALMARVRRFAST